MEACSSNPSVKSLEKLIQRARREEVLQTPCKPREVSVLEEGKHLCVHVPAREHGLSMVDDLSSTNLEWVTDTRAFYSGISPVTYV